MIVCVVYYNAQNVVCAQNVDCRLRMWIVCILVASKKIHNSQTLCIVLLLCCHDNYIESLLALLFSITAPCYPAIMR